MTRAYDLVQLRSAVQLLQASLEEVSHTAKVLCHENESLKRETEEMLHDLKTISGLEACSDPHRGLQYRWRGVWIHSSLLYVEDKARLLPKDSVDPRKPSKPDPDPYGEDERDPYDPPSPSCGDPDCDLCL